MAEFHIVSVPTSDGAEAAFRNLMRAGASSSNPFAELTKIDIPDLLVGTLDSLMLLSDDLSKADAAIDQVVKKVERTYNDLSNGRADKLSVAGVDTEQYVQQFMWDYAKYPHRRPLPSLTNLVTSSASTVDEELRTLTSALADKQSALQECKKSKGGTLLTADLSSVLGDADISRIQVLETEYLSTVFVAVPKALRSSFEASYELIGGDLVGYGNPDWVGNDRDLGKGVEFGEDVDRDKVKGSPVVPGSLKVIKEDSESVLYTLTILLSQTTSGHYEGATFKPGTVKDLKSLFSRACREKRYIVKEFVPTPGGLDLARSEIASLQASVDHMQAALQRWCTVHFGECFAAWVHLKVIRVFVESVLRYGLPVNVTSGVFRVKGEQGGKLVASLKEAYKHLGGAAGEGEEEEEEDWRPYVTQKFATAQGERE
ncbi:hypothetical protein TrRE_jg6709 [Triparma retinervis]|uniref:V-type proton ATPase subunit C n=1 Tax=Triparma retinervis TaxID=2557542 RepID=A0A9W7A435_9STRA|nr:hypothetical protein TrRE_jg6709 [Triparma retinervis]